MNIIKETRRWLPAEGEFSELNLTLGDVLLSRSEYEALKGSDDLRNRIFCAVIGGMCANANDYFVSLGSDVMAGLAHRITDAALAELEGGE